MRAVVTAGGTSEPVDDVRVLTNLSTGRFGVAIAQALAARGVEVTLLAGRTVPVADLHPRISVVPFRSFADLAARVEQAGRPAPAMWFMAAAVSDYSPVRATGKLRSDQEHATIELVRNPKLLAELRARLGPETKLVGFKLLSGVPAAELVAVGRAQLERCHLDWCVANDLQELGEEGHPVWLVDARGELRLEGHRDAVASALVERVMGQPPVELGPAETAGVVARGRFGTRASDPASACLLRAFPELEGVVWSADALTPARCASRAPAGSEALGRDVLTAILAGRPDPAGFSMRGPFGCVVGVRSRAVVEERWARFPRPDGVGSAVWEGATLAGFVHRGHGGAGLWIAPELRGQGIGTRALRQLDAEGAELVTPQAFGAWFAHRGCRTLDAQGGHTRFEPPSRRTDQVEAASVCLYDFATGRVLLGRRLREPMQGWWAFPGGKCEPGEAPLAAALRELTEETGVSVEVPVLRARHVLAVGDSPGFRLHAHVLVVPRAEPPRPSAEFDARWLSVPEALALRPLSAGTRHVLEGLS